MFDVRFSIGLIEHCRELELSETIGCAVTSSCEREICVAAVVMRDQPFQRSTRTAAATSATRLTGGSSLTSFSLRKGFIFFLFLFGRFAGRCFLTYATNRLTTLSIGGSIHSSKTSWMKSHTRLNPAITYFANRARYLFWGFVMCGRSPQKKSNIRIETVFI